MTLSPFTTQIRLRFLSLNRTNLVRSAYIVRWTKYEEEDFLAGRATKLGLDETRIKDITVLSLFTLYRGKIWRTLVRLRASSLTRLAGEARVTASVSS